MSNHLQQEKYTSLQEKYTQQRKAIQVQSDLNQNNEANHGDNPIPGDDTTDPDTERDELQGQVRALEQQVEELVMKNNDLELAHIEEVMKLQKTLDSNNQVRHRLFLIWNLIANNHQLFSLYLTVYCMIFDLICIEDSIADHGDAGGD